MFWLHPQGKGDEGDIKAQENSPLGEFVIRVPSKSLTAL